MADLDESADLAGRSYWDGLWSQESIGKAVDPSDERIHNFAVRSLHAFINDAFRGEPTQGKRLLEVGCARSAWLPYFASVLGFDIAGLDYSAIGCRQARQLLAGAGVTGDIYEGDLFDPPRNLVRSHDVVISFGLVEHFNDTAACVKALAALLAPSGALITIIPNLRGVLGHVQKRLDRNVYDLHVPLSRAELESAHRAARLHKLKSAYIMGSYWSVLNVGTWQRGWARSSVERILSWATTSSWLLERTAPSLVRANPFLSPYIGVIAIAD